MHTQKIACLRMVVISRLWCLIQLSLKLTESLAFRSHCFYHHVCAESALEIIYGFKNTDIVHFFRVILLNLFWGLLIHPNAFNSMWRKSIVWSEGFCLSMLDCCLGGDWVSCVNSFIIMLCPLHHLQVVRGTDTKTRWLDVQYVIHLKDCREDTS